MNTQTTAVHDFAPYFNSVRVDRSDTATMRAVHRLRYEVYCLECSFLPALLYADQLESDRHDAEAVHFAAFNRTGELVGYVRLVRPDAQQRLPFQDHCTDLLPAFTMPPAAHSAEISRLMVRKDYRRRPGDLLAGATAEPGPARLDGAAAAAAAAVAVAVPADERRNPSPQIMLSLYRALFRYSLDGGLQHWFAAMEKPLARVLARMGFVFQQVGAEANYFGPVAPYSADLQALQAQVGTRNPELLRWLRP